MNTLRLGACLGASLALILTGCTASTPPTPTTTPVVPANAERDINPVPRDRVDVGGLLRFGVRALPTEWNPFHADAAGTDTQRVLAPLTPTHFALDSAGRATPDPDFILGADARHDGSTVVTLQLNPNAVWGDGEPVTAADWVATWRWAKSADPGRSAAAMPGWEDVTDVRAGWSPREVQITYGGIEPDWAQPLVRGPLRAAPADAAWPANWSEYDPARYASPFLVAHVDRAQGLITLERNPLWWGEQPKLERIMFRTVQREAQAAAFLHNEFDVWETGLDTDALQQSRAATDTALRTAPGRSGRAIEVAPRGALADVAVRRALLQSVDRAAVAAADRPAGASVWSNPLLLPTQPGYVDQARATGLDSDPSAAARMLDEAGWTLTSGARVKDGQPLSLTYQATEADGRAQTEFEALTEQWAPLGVTLVAVAADADLTPRSMPISAFPLAALPGQALTTAAGQELAAKVSTEVDPIRRADHASQLARLLWQDATLITLYQEPEYVAVRAKLANLGAPGYSTTQWTSVGWQP